MKAKDKAKEIENNFAEPEKSVELIIKTLTELKSNPEFRLLKDEINKEINYWVLVREHVKELKKIR